MNWLTVALFSAALFGLINIFNKLLVTRYVPSVRAFNFYIGIVSIVIGTVSLLAVGVTEGVGALADLAAVASGVTWGMGVILMFYGFVKEETSRAVAVVQTYPVFTALLAVPLLGESLGLVHWLGIMVAVLGAVFISFKLTRDSSGKQALALTPAFAMLVVASLLSAVSYIVNKYAFNSGMGVWTNFGLRTIGMAVPFLLCWRPGVWSDIVTTFRNPTGAWLMIVTEVVCVPVGTLAMVLATSWGPVSLVSTVGASRPLFVFLFSTVLSMPRLGVLDEPLQASVVGTKMVSIGMIVGGISLMSLA